MWEMRKLAAGAKPGDRIGQPADEVSGSYLFGDCWFSLNCVSSTTRAAKGGCRERRVHGHPLIENRDPGAER